MKSSLSEQWEQRLKAEGLGNIDRDYRRNTGGIVHRLSGKPRHVFVSDYFTRCAQFQEAVAVRWPRIWKLHTQGHSIRKISRNMGTPVMTIHYRVEVMRQQMRSYFASLPVEKVEIPALLSHGMDILEIFATEQQKGRW